MKFNFNKLVVVSGVLALTVMSAFAGYWDSWRVTVQSDDFGWRLMRVPTDRPVRLVKRLSDAGCTYGKSWGVTDRGIWVNHGCRAVFEIAGTRPTTWHRDWDRVRFNGDRDHGFHQWNDRDWKNWHN